MEIDESRMKDKEVRKHYLIFSRHSLSPFCMMTKPLAWRVEEVADVRNKEAGARSRRYCTSLWAFASMAMGTTISLATHRLITWRNRELRIGSRNISRSRRSRRGTSTLSTVTPQGSHSSLNTLSISSAIFSLYPLEQVYFYYFYCYC